MFVGSSRPIKREVYASQINQIDYLAEIILRIIVKAYGLLCRPVVDGVDSQA